MKVILLQENFNKAIAETSRIAGSKVDLPILSNILLTADKTSLKLSATNLETSIVRQIPCKVEKEGKITISAKILAEIIPSLSAGKVELEVKKEQIIIKCGRFFIKLNGMEAGEFPEIPEIEEKEKNKAVLIEKIKEISRQVFFAASVDETRPVLNGVRLKVSEKEMEAVATDGYRLSRKIIKGKFEKEILSIVPARAFLEASRLEDEEGKGVKFLPDVKGNQIIFTAGNAQIISRLIEGKFPPISKVIPENWQTEVSLDKKELERSVKMASVFARQSANIMRLSVEKDKIIISANAVSIGENKSEIEAKVKGDNVQAALNFRFVQDFLNAVEGEEVGIKLSGPLTPAIFTDTNDNSFLHVIMPVRVQDSEA